MHQRLLSREEAARYTGTTGRQFAAWVRKGIMPAKIPHTLKWDIRAIDAHLDKKSGLTAREKNVVDAWNEKMEKRQSNQ
jgi:hypothetical protein